MTIPTPAFLKKQLDEKRANEITPRQAGKTHEVNRRLSTSKGSPNSSAKLVSRKSTKTDETSTSRTVSTTKPRKKDSSRSTQIGESTSGDSNHTTKAFEFFEWDDSSAPHSSRQNEDSRVSRSSSKTSRRKRSTSSQENNSTASLEVSETMESSQSKTSRNSEPSKKAFVLQDHMTVRPLLGNEDLRNLKAFLEARGDGNKVRKNIRIKQSKNNKENN